MGIRINVAVQNINIVPTYSDVTPHYFSPDEDEEDDDEDDEDNDDGDGEGKYSNGANDGNGKNEKGMAKREIRKNYCRTSSSTKFKTPIENNKRNSKSFCFYAPKHGTVFLFTRRISSLTGKLRLFASRMRPVKSYFMRPFFAKIRSSARHYDQKDATNLNKLAIHVHMRLFKGQKVLNTALSVKSLPTPVLVNSYGSEARIQKETLPVKYMQY
ncbi:hypothetical protein HELRODRAFT_168941 [Helobdella robusta]|uniref:Uncharacterized protein n=1 Tax=Helobdella robusta TaxID=6412 RepID=T1F161_HELRO|nr:hypothetical protein HELRODRAFT_168941 [Helobdella robusta]ESO09009.1 hypothetical protein HELRODRAFT_168941 [Helobdella robusta]